MAIGTFVSRFSPNRTDPALLEAIFVQRHALAEAWLERLRDSALGEIKHHLLAVGPRGCGKSHLVALLLSRLRKDPEVNEQQRIAWLPEDETTTSFWKFLLRILRSLNTEYGDEFPPPPRDVLAKATDERRTSLLSAYLLEKLGDRKLLVVVENLDDVMKGLKDEGQKRLRAFLQEHPVTSILATSQQLTKDLSDRDRPFFNFFQIERLQPLTSDEALELLQKLSDQGSDEELREFLKTAAGRARVRAIRHLTGGNHRVFIILSEFVTKEKLDDLVSAFEELLDELTPYYQERLRWLPDQQREIVEFLCRQVYTVTVKQIATELFLEERQAAAQLKSLKNKGYVTSESVGRESRYEIAEPLMRLCIEVKDPRREPIRLIVEFLRVWYDQEGVLERLQHLPSDADMEKRYFEAALTACKSNVADPVEVALLSDLEQAVKTVRHSPRNGFPLLSVVNSPIDEVLRDIISRLAERTAKRPPSTPSSPCESNTALITSDHLNFVRLTSMLGCLKYLSSDYIYLIFHIIQDDIKDSLIPLAPLSRILEVGFSYVHTKDERVLFDLVREERMILQVLFGLDK